MSEILNKFKKLCCDYGHKSSSVFAIEFRRIRELESEIESALKLQQLVKERIKQTDEWKQHPDWINKEGISIVQGQFITNTELESLVEKSEK